MEIGCLDGRIPGLPVKESKAAASDDRAVEESHQTTARNSLAAEGVLCGRLEATASASTAQGQTGDNGSAKKVISSHISSRRLLPVRSA